jgi:hypothetical protein
MVHIAYNELIVVVKAVHRQVEETGSVKILTKHCSSNLKYCLFGPCEQYPGCLLFSSNRQ